MKFTPFRICCRGRVVSFEEPAILGILNVTEDSFYDGGRYRTDEQIVAHAKNLLAQGADIIDIGVVSSRPGAQLLSPEAEAQRLTPVVALLRRELPAETLLSVDTCYALPATKAVEAGADIINDISGGQFDCLVDGGNTVNQSRMFAAVAEMQVPYILMHTRGLPATMQSPENTCYDDIITDLTRYFSEQLDTLLRLGMKDIIFDPGFGFAKTTEQNYELLYRLDELVRLFPERPMLVALSNKSMIKKRIEEYPDRPKEISSWQSDNIGNRVLKDFHLPATELGTMALNAIALDRGASLLRVHTPYPSRIAVALRQQ